jgi:predicted cupin superfamily sugar epimerase
MRSAAYWISKLNLQQHPEGGYFCETYRSSQQTEIKDLGIRNFSTAIYFLMETENFSAFHKIRSDELWHFYAGDPLEVIYFSSEGELVRLLLGNDPDKGEVFQAVVPAGVWFGSRPVRGGSFSLVGCTVSPGFDFRDFEMANREELLNLYPAHQTIIEQLTRD